MISTVFMKKAKIPVTVDIQRVTGILYVLKCQRWDSTTFCTFVNAPARHLAFFPSAGALSPQNAPSAIDFFQALPV